MNDKNTNHNLFKEIFKNLLSLTITQVLAQVFAFFATVYVSRVVGVEQYGVLGFVTSILIYFDMISNMGLEMFSIRELARDHNKLPHYVWNVAIMRLLSSALCISIIWTLYLFNSDSLPLTLLLIYSLTLILKAFVLNWVFAAFRKMELYGITQTITQLIYMIACFTFITGRDDIFYVPIAFNISFFVAAGFTWIVLLFRKENLSFRINFDQWPLMLKQSLPMIASFIIIRIYLNFSLIYLGLLGENRILGYYNAAYKIFFLLFAIREILTSVAYPLMAKYYSESIDNLKTVMDGFIKLALLFAFPVFIGGSILSREIIVFVFSIEYQDAYLPMIIMLLSYFLMMINILFPSAQNAFNRQNTYFKISVINSFTNIVANIVFINLFGMIGAALAMAITELQALILYKISTNKIINIKIFKKIFKIVIPGSIMGVFLIILPDFFVLYKIGLAALVYLTGLFLFRVINSEDILNIKQIIVRK